jgi:nitrogen fixation NifU-like protein
MSADDLYHQAMVRLAREAHAAGSLTSPDAAVTLDNPLCGDRITVEVQVRDGVVVSVAHRVRGCVLCEAAASLIGRTARGATLADAEEGRAAVAAMLRSSAPAPRGTWAGLSVFAPVAAAPSRHRCVLLPFEALCEALARTLR